MMQGISMLAFARLAVVALTLGGLAGTADAQGVPYVIDSKRSEVLISYSMTLSSGVARFTSVSGTASIDDAAQQNTTVQAVIDTRTLRAPVSMAQGELRGTDFFDVAVYPQMLFKSRSVRPKTATAAEIIGDITVKGVTRPIVLQATLQPPGAGGAREFRAKTRINRNDFKMTAYALLVGDTVDIEIRALLRPQ
jgi:polyisoprenoid-binding protein YceI